MSCAAGPTSPRSAPSCLSVIWWQSVTGVCAEVHVAAMCNQDEGLLHNLCSCKLLHKCSPFSLDELCFCITQVAKLIIVSIQADQIHLIALKV